MPAVLKTYPPPSKWCVDRDGVEEIVEGGLDSQNIARKVEGDDKLTESRKALGWRLSSVTGRVSAELSPFKGARDSLLVDVTLLRYL